MTPREALLIALALALLFVLLRIRRLRAERVRDRLVLDFHRLLVQSHLAHGGFEQRDPFCMLCQARVRFDPQVRALVERHA